MRFEWDPHKNRRNQQKHGLSFELAQKVFEDPKLLSDYNGHVNDENRWQALGQVNGMVLLLVVYTIRQHNGNDITRIISARKATKSERTLYEHAY